ncbi:MAG: ATP-dependent DNA helicase RecG [Alphaproteobacteria bacterium 64-11]|nr:ATP-dependent DNA helicase RecG [Alphaproteobacteria bacterium]OJU12950.1 MAG: ATP-dependent DNA helicase RecG [Alphaproteobacteria bacterium 64-11]
MRPAILFPLFAEIRTLSGVGPKLEKLIAKILGHPPTGPRLVDLVFDLPVGVVDRSYRPRLIEAEPGRIATVEINVLEHKPSRGSSHSRGQPYRVMVSDDSAVMDLVFFHGVAEYLNSQLPAGSRRVVSGRIERFKDRLQMAHPDYIVPPEQAAGLPAHEPVYGLTEGLTAKPMAKAVRGALDRVPRLPEWQDEAFVKREGFDAFNAALEAAHNPVHEADLAPTAPARRRLAYDEMLANQLALRLIRENMRQSKGRSVTGTGRLKALAVGALPFALTDGQLMALGEIEQDMASDRRMLRLLQGDVGSGKTIVALLAMLGAVEAGLQAALMAPTELLVRQHLASLEPYANAAGVRLACLTGREKGVGREATLARLAAGEIDILVGTHALFSEDVSFRDLGLAVVDEQHRFGVHQRMKLQSKGRPADVLVMTATPIPRTLALTAYGDMDVSRITGRPPGRKPVETRVLSADRLEELIAHLRAALDRGERAYWVCPLVEESEKIDLAAAEGRAVMLKQALGLPVGLVHGKMKAAERDAAMAAFKAGETKLLVATTVIEVGVDVPEATIMVVEHAERFGLAQLHQLRGRVGRGAGKSSCILVWHEPLGETARARLKTMRDTDDGFVIAEEDLRLRGAGEMLGTRQSGMEAFRLADPVVHADLLAIAHDDARLVLARDPDLKSSRGRALRVLLYLFGRDDAVRYLRTG